MAFSDHRKATLNYREFVSHTDATEPVEFTDGTIAVTFDVGYARGPHVWFEAHAAVEGYSVSPNDYAQVSDDDFGESDEGYYIKTIYTVSNGLVTGFKVFSDIVAGKVCWTF